VVRGVVLLLFHCLVLNCAGWCAPGGVARRAGNSGG